MIDFDRDTAFTQRVLDALAMRGKMSLHNIANQNTPGFKRYEVRFEELLQQASSAGKDLASVRHEVVHDTSGAPEANNVVLMDEMALLGKTSLLHDVMTRRLAGYTQKLNKAIFGR
ncbi:MAG: flagellar biosynthesis protein FlgB [Planctomycetes bacterium]|nr:flagellar biosynthesis protein FlgB [Planctomycetota bacterium]